MLRLFMLFVEPLTVLNFLTLPYLGLFFLIRDPASSTDDDKHPYPVSSRDRLIYSTPRLKIIGRTVHAANCPRYIK